MIDRIIKFSITNKLIIGLIVLTLIGWGTYSLTQIPVDAVPDITNNQVQVITSSPTLAAQEVEKFITYPLEISMGNVPGVIEIRSISRFGLSVITVVFEEDVDIYLARQLIGERIKMAEDQIPEGMGSPDLGPITTGLGEIYQYAIRTEPGYDTVYDAMELRSIQDWIVKRQLAGIPGVIEVNSAGGYLKQYEVALNPDKLRSMDITIEDVFLALKNNNENTGGSYIEKAHYTYFIRGEGLIKDKPDIQNIVVKTRNGIPVLVKDIAEVGFGHAPRFGAMTMNGIGEVVGGQVMMLKGANSAEVTKRVKERMEQIKASLPEGVIIDPYLDREKLVSKTTKTVTKNLIEGGLIVVFILVLLLGNLRAGLVVASVIPLAMLFALGLMNIFGVSANLMSLGAIDFGLIVDGAVIIVESIVHRLHDRFNGNRLTATQMDDEVFTAATKIRKSAAFGEIIILIVYIPILTLVGVEGKMFRPMAQTVSFAIIGALILSLTYVPMMSALFLSKNIVNKTTIADRIMAVIHRAYDPVIRLALKAKTLVLVIALGLFLVSIWVFSRMGGEFIPTLEEGDFALHQILPPGSSLKEGVEVSDDLQRILMENFPEVEKVVTKIGTAEIPTDVMPLEAGDIYVIMKDQDEWVSADSREEMFEKMEAELSKFPGVMYEFTQPIQMRFNELMTGIRQDIAVKIYGEDMGVLYKSALNAREIIEGISGVGDMQVEQVSGLQQMVVDYDRKKIAQYGLTISDVNRVIRTAFAGEKAGVVFEGEKQFDLVVRLDEAHRQGIGDLRNLYVDLPNGEQIPLYQLAAVEFREGPVQISRDNTKRRIVIGVNARNRDVESLVAEIKDELNAKLDLPPAYYVTFGGQFENLVQAKNRLMIAVPLALFLIFVLLHLTFNSFTQAAMIFTAVPLSAIGGILALYLRDMHFSISAGVGFIALFGVAVLNGIVLLSYFNQLKKEGVTDIRERILKGTSVRLRPVVMTASVASLGFLPMAISQSAGAEVQRPLATVVIGGLITATFLTMVVLPVLYYLIESRLKFRKGATIVTFLLISGGLLYPTNNLNAQGTSAETIMIENCAEAVLLGIENHPTVKRSELMVEQQERLKGASFDLPYTNVSYTNEETDFDQIEGIRSIGVSQQMDFPATYISKAKLQREQVTLSREQLNVTEAVVTKNVSHAYYLLQHNMDMLDLMQKLDTIYGKFGEAARKRFDSGETGKLEWLSARNQQQQIKLKLAAAEAAVIAGKQTLLLWLNNGKQTLEVSHLPKYKSADLEITIADSGIVDHALLGYYQQQQRVALQTRKYQQSILWPKLQGGFQWQSIDGVGGFYGYNVGLNLPLWALPQRRRIQAARAGETIAGLEYNQQQIELQQEYAEALRKYALAEQSLEVFESGTLDMIDEQQDAAEKGYRLGAIDYMEYIQNMEQAKQFQQNYLRQLLEYNLAIVEIEYLTNK